MLHGKRGQRVCRTFVNERRSWSPCEISGGDSNEAGCKPHSGSTRVVSTFVSECSASVTIRHVYRRYWPINHLSVVHCDERQGMARDVLADRRTLPESAARPREIGGGRKKEECPRHSTSCLRPPSSYGPRYHAAHMPLGSLRAWLGLDREETNEYAPLRDILERLDHL